MRPVIAGAGPVGSTIARLIKDLKPIMVDERSTIGMPVHCTGIVSTKLKELTNFPEELILNKVKGAKFFSGNKSVILKPNKVMAHIIDRAGFDKWLYESSGIEASLNEKFINYSANKAITNKSSIKTNLLIDCTGAKKGILGVQAVTNLKRDTELVELHFNESRDFFAWVVPVNNNLCRVGLAGYNKPMINLKHFLKKINAGRVIEWNAGMIPLEVNEFISDNHLKCGDAAGHVKPLTGGGLVTGILSAEILSKAVIKGAEINNYTKEFFMKEYYTPWKKTIGKELRLSSIARKITTKVNSDELINFIKNNKSILESYGDMDFIGKFAIKLLRLKNINFLIKSIIKIL